MKKYQEFLSISWRRYLLPPIHPEGLKIIGTLFLAVVVIGLFFPKFWIVGLPIILFSFYFFRNPPRVTPQKEGEIIAPADGIVCAIAELVPPKTLGIGTEPLIRISTFMSVFNVHVNRVPVSGKVSALTYHKGKFVNVAHKDSEDNERQEICIQTKENKKIGFVQIAGLVARRIYCPLSVGQEVKKGDVFGLIRFGSRLDVYLPKGTEPKVMIGQTMIAGETVLALIQKKDS